MAHDWSEDDRSQVANLLRAGLSASHIAGQFPSTSRNAIIGLVHRSKQLMAVGFARSPGNVIKPKPKKPPMQKPENRFAALIKPRLVNRKPDSELKHRKPRLPLPPAWPIVPMHIPMVDIVAGQCRYPMWNGFGGPHWLMCGAATALEQSYCAGHKATVYEARER